MSSGVAAGATTICHDAASKPAKPCSAIEEIPGRAATRSLVETPSAHLALVDQAERRRDVAEHELNMSGRNVAQGRHGAAIRHMRHLDASHALEQLGKEMVRRAEPGRSEGELAGLGLGEFDETAHRLHR